METVIQVLAKNPLLLLFAVAAIGYPIGRIKVGGASLGIAALLFVGIAFGALDGRLKLPEAFYQLGLALFVYTIGLTSAPGFFAALNRKGMRTNLLAGIILTVGGLAAVLITKAILHLPNAMGVGLYTGSFTNSPALAAAVEVLKAAGGDTNVVSQPVVAYSIAYPMGVLGPMLALLLVRKMFKVDFQKEADAMPASLTGRQQLEVRSLRVTNPAAVGPTRDVVAKLPGAHIVFGRIRRNGQLLLPTGETRLELGDEVTAVATPQDLCRAVELLGEPLTQELSLDHSEFDFKRVFVSNPQIVGRPLSELNLPTQYGAIITRIRRGDLDLVPHGGTILELGDRVRVTSRRENMEAVTKFFGDSYRALSEVDLLNFSLGLALGLLLGSIPVPLPGGVTFKLGFAGGPLVMALILGKLQRSGPIVWTIPYSANLTLRQLGLLLFAAGIGTIAGEGFAKTVASGAAGPLFAAGAVLSFVAPMLLLILGLKLFRMPLSLLAGVMAASHTQPVLLAFGNEQTKNEVPSIGYATVYPFATVLKVVLAQLLLLLLK
jgi:putative transport protein